MILVMCQRSLRDKMFPGLAARKLRTCLLSLIILAHIKKKMCLSEEWLSSGPVGNIPDCCGEGFYAHGIRTLPNTIHKNKLKMD